MDVNAMIKKIVKVQGIEAPFVFGPDLPEEVLEDEDIMDIIHDAMPTILATQMPSWDKQYDADLGVNVWRASLTPRAQTKGAF